MYFALYESRDKHKRLQLVLAVELREQGSLLSENLQLHSDSVDLSELHSVGEGISHNGYEHVEHSHLREERSGEEKDDQQPCPGVALEVPKRLKLSKREEILVEQGVNEPPSDVLTDQ